MGIGIGVGSEMVTPGRTRMVEPTSRSPDDCNAWPMSYCADLQLDVSASGAPYDATSLGAARRTSNAATDGLGKREIIRCLKRYIAREIFTNLPDPRPSVQPLNRYELQPCEEHRSSERYNRTLTSGSANRQPFTPTPAEPAALTVWLKHYDTQ
jgi:hypothetical protein